MLLSLYALQHVQKIGKTGIEQISYVHGNQPHSLSPHLGAMSSLGLSASLSSAPIGGGGEHRSQEGAVVVSIDPERVHVSSPDDVPFKCVKASTPGALRARSAPSAPFFATSPWPKRGGVCMVPLHVSGGREGRPIGAFELAQAVEQLGAREILLNCIDFGGQAQGFDLDLVGQLSSAVSISVIASRAAAQASQSTSPRSLLTQAPLVPPSHGRSGPGL
ncbi:unnamed protein product [Closterium sp. NIES-65]|nr:unnamed protein product [Closterium sp. NIES-65]